MSQRAMNEALFVQGGRFVTPALLGFFPLFTFCNMINQFHITEWIVGGLDGQQRKNPTVKLRVALDEIFDKFKK